MKCAKEQPTSVDRYVQELGTIKNFFLSHSLND